MGYLEAWWEARNETARRERCGRGRAESPPRPSGLGSVRLQPRGGTGSLCACAGDSGPAVKPAVASRQKAGPHPHQPLCSQPGPAPAPAPPPPPSLGCWPPGVPVLQKTQSGGGQRSSSTPRCPSRPPPEAGSPRTLAPIWLPHWPACRCTISRMAVALLVDAAAVSLVLGAAVAGPVVDPVVTAAATKQGPCAPGAPLYERAGPASPPVTGQLRLLSRLGTQRAGVEGTPSPEAGRPQRTRARVRQGRGGEASQVRSAPSPRSPSRPEPGPATRVCRDWARGGRGR